MSGIAVEREMGSRRQATLGRRLLSAFLWAFVGVVVLLWLPLLAVIFAVTVPFDRGRYAVGRWFRRAAIVFTKVNPLWDFRVSGVRIRDPRRPYVAISNHESFADIFLISHLPWEMKWVSKEGIFKIPVMGWLMRIAGDICVRREDLESRSASVQEIKDRLARRVSVLIFPEGTRSKTGDILPFRNGAFRVAVAAGAPILPMCVAGTRAAIPKGSLLFGRARAEVRVLEPIETRGMTQADVPALRERVRAAIVAARQQLQAELAGA